MITVEYLLAISSVTGFINFEACLWSAICFQSMIAAFFHAGSTSLLRLSFRFYWFETTMKFNRWIDLSFSQWNCIYQYSDVNRSLFDQLNFQLVHFWFPELQRIRKQLQPYYQNLHFDFIFWSFCFWTDFVSDFMVSEVSWIWTCDGTVSGILN